MEVDKKISLDTPKEVRAACSTPGCTKPSSLQCPTCLKLGLPPAFFCDQDCFKAFWPMHKFYHAKDTQTDKKKDSYPYTGPLRPGKVSPRLFVPETIPKPEYAISGMPNEEARAQSVIEVKSPEEIEKMRAACLIGRKALDAGHKAIRVGITTDEIDKIVHESIISQGGYPSPLNYRGFPKSLCTSVNEVICHGIPDDRPLEDGDIVNLDIGVFYKGMHSDLNETYCVGKVADSSKYLIEHTYRALEKAIAICKPGVMYRDVGNVIDKYAKDCGLSVVRTYTGHGVGRHFHCAPNIPHYSNNKAVGTMKVGHIFTIEPMINQGTWKDITWNDNWTSVTQDGQRSAQFEQTLLITQDGCEVLTKRLEDSPPLDFKI
jgi:methionyl aminopeptidase